MSLYYVVCGKSEFKSKAVQYVQSGNITPLILNIGTRWMRVVWLTHRLLYTCRQNPQPPLTRRLSGLQKRSTRFVKEKILLRLPYIEPCFLVCPDRRLVTIVTKSRLHDPFWSLYLYYWLFGLFGKLKFPETDEVPNSYLKKHWNLRKSACSGVSWFSNLACSGVSWFHELAFSIIILFWKLAWSVVFPGAAN